MHPCQGRHIKSSKFCHQTSELPVLTPSIWKQRKTRSPSTQIVSSSINLCRWNQWHRDLQMHRVQPNNSQTIKTTLMCTTKLEHLPAVPQCTRKDQPRLAFNRPQLCKTIITMCPNPPSTWCKPNNNISKWDSRVLTGLELNPWLMQKARRQPDSSTLVKSTIITIRKCLLGLLQESGMQSKESSWLK